MDQAYESTIRDPKFRTDNFMMYGFKIAQCSRQGRHPWCSCPFAHPTENARRRDPRLYNYTCNECQSYRNHGYCVKGDLCENSHGVFEARLHPDSYRTVSCKEGLACKREVCFFYHTPEEQRQPTGLAAARAQASAELGDAALELDPRKLSMMASGLMPSSLQSYPSLHSQASLHAHPSLHSHMSLQTPGPRMQSMASLSPSGAGMSGHFSLHSAMSGMSPMARQNSHAPDMGLVSETVAPCIRGANRNKLLLREIALAEGLKPETLANSLRVAILQGELSAYSSALSLPPGHFSERTEAVIENLAQREECDAGKLRGWLARIAATPMSKQPSGMAGARPEYSHMYGEHIGAYYPDGVTLRDGHPGAPSTPATSSVAPSSAHSQSTAGWRSPSSPDPHGVPHHALSDNTAFHVQHPVHVAMHSKPPGLAVRGAHAAQQAMTTQMALAMHAAGYGPPGAEQQQQRASAGPFVWDADPQNGGAYAPHNGSGHPQHGNIWHNDT